MRLVMKFGGTSVGDGSRIRSVSDLVANYAREGNAIVVVVSAMGGVTDALVGAIERAGRGDFGFIGGFVRELGDKHRQALNVVEKDELRRDAVTRIEETLENLEKVLFGISCLREVTPRSRDLVLSTGEQLSAPILSACLVQNGLCSRWFTGGEAGLITDNRFGDARPLMDVTRRLVRERLEPLTTRGCVPVVTGYIACTREGIVTTLGRGGSDYTASILGAALGVDEVWIWTDVDGVMTTDPRVDPSARVIPVISYAEATEMAYFGAKVLHPRTLEPAMEDDIPVRIRNSFNPGAPGTLIVKEHEVKVEGAVKAVAMIRDVALVTVSGTKMLGVPGVAAEVFGVLGRLGINVLMISQASSEANISFVIPCGEVAGATRALEDEFAMRNHVSEVDAEEDVCVVAVVGAGMRGSPGVAARVFHAVASHGVNVRMIAQGSSELNISFVVKEETGRAAVRAVHEEFKLGGG